MWIAFAFGSALFAGITAILAKVGIRSVNSNVATAVRTVIVLLFSWMMVFVVGSFDQIGNLSGKTLLFLILSGLATGGSWLCYFKALQKGSVSKVTPIDKSSTVFTILLAFVFLKEPIGIWKLFGILAIATGTFLMLGNRKQEQEKESERGWLFYAVLSAVFASLTSILGKVGIQGVESNLGTAIRTVVVLLMAWVVVFVTKEQGQVRQIDRRSMLFLCLSGITTGLSWLCYYKALQDGQAGVVVPIDKLSIVVTIAFSYVVFKEKLSKKALVGLLVLVCGTLLLLV